MTTKPSDFLTSLSPIRQGIYLAAIALAVMLAGKVGIGTSNPMFPWLASGAFLLLFLVGNNVLAIFSPNFAQYAQMSMLVFLSVLVTLGLAAYGLSGVSIFEARGSYRTIYLVFILAYFSLLAICFLIRQAVDFIREKDRQMHS